MFDVNHKSQFVKLSSNDTVATLTDGKDPIQYYAVFLREPVSATGLTSLRLRFARNDLGIWFGLAAPDFPLESEGVSKF